MRVNLASQRAATPIYWVLCSQKAMNMPKRQAYKLIRPV